MGIEPTTTPQLQIKWLQIKLYIILFVSESTRGCISTSKSIKWHDYYDQTELCISKLGGF